MSFIHQSAQDVVKILTVLYLEQPGINMVYCPIPLAVEWASRIIEWATFNL